MNDLATGTCMDGRLSELRGRSVLLAADDQLAAALAMIELNGVARRIVICTPDLTSDQLPVIAAKGAVDAVVSDRPAESFADIQVPLHVKTSMVVKPASCSDRDSADTEWILLTSATSGVPKLVAHNLASLTAPIKPTPGQGVDAVWGTFYDVRRYGGLQILLRALLGGVSLVLSAGEETIKDHLLRLAARRVTHINGTPSHWRRVLMSPAAGLISPRYVRLSGEIADQGVLDSLNSFYPQAQVSHAFASTEAGVVFEVVDGCAGFPRSVVGSNGPVDLKIEDGSIRVRSARTASRYVGDAMELRDREGFVDTGDIVELHGGRYSFLGRRTGIINVGGLKIHPEEIEMRLNQHPSVRMSRVRRRHSPIVGSLVVADVVLESPGTAGVTEEILNFCRQTLPRHKVPAMLNVVSALEVAASGKIARKS